MENKYVCRECEKACVLIVYLEAHMIPDECPWEGGARDLQRVDPEIDLSPMYLTKESLAEWLRPYLKSNQIIHSWEIIEDRHLRLTIHRKEESK